MKLTPLSFREKKLFFEALILKKETRFTIWLIHAIWLPRLHFISLVSSLDCIEHYDYWQRGFFLSQETILDWTQCYSSSQDVLEGSQLRLFES